MATNRPIQTQPKKSSKYGTKVREATVTPSLVIYSTSSDKKRTKEIKFPYEEIPIPADHQEELDPYVILVCWDVKISDFPNHATIKRGLHDILIENLGFYDTNTSSVLEADVATLCSLLAIPYTLNEHKILPALRTRLNLLIDAGVQPNNGLYGDYNAAAAWLNTIYNHECDSLPTSPKEDSAPLVMYIARRAAVFG